MPPARSSFTTKPVWDIPTTGQSRLIIFYSSFVVEYIVPVGQEHRFNQWYARLVDAARQFEGYTRTDLCPPLDCGDGVVKWYYIVHFATPKALKHWLDSDTRQRLLKEGQDTFLAYRYKSFTTGLEGWFSNQSGVNGEQNDLGPPGLEAGTGGGCGAVSHHYGTGVNFLVPWGVMQTWPMPISMVVNNLITSSVLTGLVMPQVSRVLGFWLYPAYRLGSRRRDIAGALMVIVALIGMAGIFLVIREGVIAINLWRIQQRSFARITYRFFALHWTQARA